MRLGFFTGPSTTVCLNVRQGVIQDVERNATACGARDLFQFLDRNWIGKSMFWLLMHLVMLLLFEKQMMMMWSCRAGWILLLLLLHNQFLVWDLLLSGYLVVTFLLTPAFVFF